MLDVIVSSYNYFSPNGEHSEQRILAHKLEQPTAGGPVV